MTYKDAVFDRILDLESSLKRIRRTIESTGSSLTKERFAVTYTTYLLNIDLFNQLSGQDYKSQIDPSKGQNAD